MATTRTITRPGALARPAAPAHQDALDGLRAGAAGAVLVTHVAGMTGYVLSDTPVAWICSRGDVGVPIFFTLSGLLLYRRWAADALTGAGTGRTGSYLRRRALRILPAYWAVVLIALPVFNAGSVQQIWHWVQYLLLLQIYDPRPWWSGTGAVGLAQTWSLAVEVSFYLVLPLLAAALTWFAARGGPRTLSARARRLLTAIGILAASSFGFTALAYYPQPNWWFSGTLPPLMIWFCVGMAIAVVQAWAAAEPEDGPARRFGRAVAASTGMCMLIAACAFAIACTPVTGPEFAGIPGLWGTASKTALYAIVATGLVAPVALHPLLGRQAAGLLSARLLGSRVSRFLGKISYGIFLWQFVAAYAFFDALHLPTVLRGANYTPIEVALLGVVVAAGTVILATASYYLVERPFQRFRQARPSRQPSSGQPQVVTAQAAPGQAVAAQPVPVQVVTGQVVTGQQAPGPGQ